MFIMSINSGANEQALIFLPRKEVLWGILNTLYILKTQMLRWNNWLSH